MENASKALLMAGGILVALLVIGALMLMFNQIGSYGNSQNENKKISQLAEFNSDFEKYMDDKGINGTDIISLINKVIDYNNKAKKGGVANSVDYDIKMSITISGLDNFNDKYAYEDINYKMFQQPSYTIGNEYDKLTNQLKKDLDATAKIENIEGISKDQLKQLSGMYEGTNQNESKEKIKEQLIEINSIYENWDGKNMEPTLDSIKKYRQYWEFKTSKFVPVGDAVYENGQITHMEFKFDK